MGTLWDMDTYTYNSDHLSTAFIVGLSTLVAAAGGFVGAAGLTNYPRGWKMRRVYGINVNNQHASIPVGSAANGLYTGATTSFTIHSDSYLLQGRIGEKRRVRI